MRLYLDEKTMENTYKSLAFMNFDVVNIDKENKTYDLAEYSTEVEGAIDTFKDLEGDKGW